MVDFKRQAALNGRQFETLARAIAHKDPDDVQAIISFDKDAITGDRPPDLTHNEIERLRAGSEFQACLPEIDESEAAEQIKRDYGRVASVVVHPDGNVTAIAIVATSVGPAHRQRVQNEVNRALRDIRLKNRIVKGKRRAVG